MDKKTTLENQFSIILSNIFIELHKSVSYLDNSHVFDHSDSQIFVHYKNLVSSWMLKLQYHKNVGFLTTNDLQSLMIGMYLFQRTYVKIKYLPDTDIHKLQQLKKWINEFSVYESDLNKFEPDEYFRFDFS